jgi:hypothetical protein
MRREGAEIQIAPIAQGIRGQGRAEIGRYDWTYFHMNAYLGLALRVGRNRRNDSVAKGAMISSASKLRLFRAP